MDGKWRMKYKSKDAINHDALVMEWVCGGRGRMDYVCEGEKEMASAGFHVDQWMVTFLRMNHYF
jgi:hypothetical protein